MITIDGLTKEQVAMMDTMWSKDTTEEYDTWHDSLSEAEMNLVDTLEQLLFMEMQESRLDVSQALELLEKFTKAEKL